MYKLASIWVFKHNSFRNKFKITNKSARFNDSPDTVTQDDEEDDHYHMEQVCVYVTGEDFFHHFLGLSATAAIVTNCHWCYSDHLLLLQYSLLLLW